MILQILKFTLKFAVLFSIFLCASSKNNDIDLNGYVVFCPGMGQFDNQVEQFIGALAFAKETQRTLVLPYWIEYHLEDKDAVRLIYFLIFVFL